MLPGIQGTNGTPETLSVILHGKRWTLEGQTTSLALETLMDQHHFPSVWVQPQSAHSHPCPYLRHWGNWAIAICESDEKIETEDTAVQIISQAEQEGWLNRIHATLQEGILKVHGLLLQHFLAAVAEEREGSLTQNLYYPYQDRQGAKLNLAVNNMKGCWQI